MDDACNRNSDVALVRVCAGGSTLCSQLTMRNHWGIEVMMNGKRNYAPYCMSIRRTMPALNEAIATHEAQNRSHHVTCNQVSRADARQRSIRVATPGAMKRYNVPQIPPLMSFDWTPALIPSRDGSHAHLGAHIPSSTASQCGAGWRMSSSLLD